MLEVQNVSRLYTRAGREFWALKNASLTLRPGEFVTLLGRSGSGKSTLLNIVVGLVKPTDGKVFVDGRELGALDDEAASALRNAYFGFVPQGAGLLSSLTVLDNVRLPWSLMNRGPEPEGRAQALLEAVGLGELAQQYPASLSGGEMRRVAIARALMCDPAMIVADEPTSSLDRETAKDVVALFAKLAREEKKGVLVVTHDDTTLAVSDRIFDMHSGTLTERNAQN